VPRRAPRFDGLSPASKAASRAKVGNKGADTRCECLLRSALWRLGLRFRKNSRQLPGKPDVVFSGQRLAVFCDGDFWHGRDWRRRKKKLSKGTNAAYWIAKIEANRERDRHQDKALREMGWTVIRVWETDVLADVHGTSQRIAAIVHELSAPAE